MGKAAMIFCVVGFMLTDIDQVLGGGWFQQEQQQFKVTSQSSQPDYGNFPCTFTVSVTGNGVKDQFHVQCSDKEELIYATTDHALYVSDKEDPLKFAFFTNKPKYLVVVRDSACTEIRYTKASRIFGKITRTKTEMSQNECETATNDILAKLT